MAGTEKTTPEGDASNADPKPFDASLFFQSEAEKPSSPSFPSESPFMEKPSDTLQSTMEQSSDKTGGSGEEARENDQSGPLVKDTQPSVTSFFTKDQSLIQSSGSFFDSFASAVGDENDLFSTPPSSVGATPVSPEGRGGFMEDPLGISAEVSMNAAEEVAGVNSETVSIDSTNLLTEEDAKMGSGSNMDTMSMDSTNLLSEEDKDDQSVDQGNESFEAKNDLVEEDGEMEAAKGALETTISLESPEAETTVIEEGINDAATESNKGDKDEPVAIASAEVKPPETVPDLPKDDADTSLDVKDKVAVPDTQVTTPNKSTTIESQGPSSPPLSVTSQEDTVTDSSDSLGVPPALMSSFSAPSGLTNPNPVRPHVPFQSIASQEDDDDPFVEALRTSESDRRHDAWVPSEATQKILVNRSIALQGSEYVIRDQLTMPGIIAEEPQGDPIKELVQRYMGEQESAKRSVLTVNQVTRDEHGLKRLLDAGCLRAAVDLTGLLLTSGAQGKGQAGMPSRHTPHLMQVWFTRISVLMKLQQFTAAEQELDAFGNMDKPDLFFGYYPDLYPGRQGSMVPFSFRLIHAELAMYVGKHQLCLDRLSAILSVCHKIVKNLQDGKSEYGQSVELSEENRKASLDLWESRQIRVLHSVGNCLVSMKEYMQAVNVFKSLVVKEPENEINILCGIARVYLQLGDLKSAQDVYSEIEKKIPAGGSSPGKQARIHINRGFLKVAQNQYAEAYKHFNEGLKIEPTNFMAINNVSVCCLYLGKLKESLSLLENLVNKDSSEFLDESLIFNLCTLYELESSKSTVKKQNLLGLVSKHKGDGFNVSCLKMP
ncbi:trafficking protein particle complex subunit 12 [Strongylocentrotus purpuratus]|uniref:Trafficking protein particle complex subunit 12 n=1 Tax=Strongylocentrotus purpuratus TaxID=7668 RepID=A0A7M7NQ63_STRPU|nr:trafficking protein particle complex subunit 12 [Strongylocentrotus purpuratus]